MIESISFTNFKILREAELILRPFNILVGPNGSGKSTVIKALETVKNPPAGSMAALRTVGVESGDVEIRLRIKSSGALYPSRHTWLSGGGHRRTNLAGTDLTAHSLENYRDAVDTAVNNIQAYSLDPAKVASVVQLTPNARLDRSGGNLAAALDNLRDESRRAFNELESELNRWLPEFDSVLFQTPAPGQRSFGLGRTKSQQMIRASDLSDGTLIALALLYIVHSVKRASVICLEEPDRGLHPRLLRDLRDALYRLSYPDQFGINREPVQVIATTHSPYFLDLFKDHPEEIIIAQKKADATATFKSLAEDKDLIEMIGDAPLGEVWYSGVLGGVPAR